MTENGREVPAEAQNDERQVLALRAKERNRLLILSRPNVIGLDVGYRVRGEEITDESVVVAYVSQKVDRELLREEDLIPATVRVDDQEVPTDVVESSIGYPQIYNTRSRPLRGGNSISPSALGASSGTCGICLSIDSPFILGCNHVLANTNALRIGSTIIQPGAADGGSAPNDTVATLTRFVPIDFGSTTVSFFKQTWTVPNPNDVDVAIAAVLDAYSVGNREIHWIGYPAMLAAAPMTLLQQMLLIGTRVCKMGRTTDFTTGTISSGVADRTIGPYPGGGRGRFAFFRNQIQITGDNRQPFSQPGDSGSLVVTLDEPHVPLGLLFAGPAGGGVGPSWANPIQKVLQVLDFPRI